MQWRKFMSITRPDHIDTYVEKLPNKNKYIECSDSEYTTPYEVKCSCGCKDFTVFYNQEPRVEVQCSRCGKQIIVYDLDLYTCSQKYMPRDLGKYTSPEGDSIFRVGVVYEYSDEFSLEDDEFDNNDVTWCLVFVQGIQSGKIYKIVDDETA